MTSFEKIQCVYLAVSDCDKVLPNELMDLHESHDSQINSVATTFRQVALCHLKQNPTDYEKPYKRVTVGGYIDDTGLSIIEFNSNFDKYTKSRFEIVYHLMEWYLINKDKLKL